MKTIKFRGKSLYSTKIFYDNKPMKCVDNIGLPEDFYKRCRIWQWKKSSHYFRYIEWIKGRELRK